MSSKKFVYIIYDIYTHEVFDFYKTEEECLKVFNEYFNGFVNANWIALNTTYCLDLHIERKKRYDY